jgi:hypothetical protein
MLICSNHSVLFAFLLPVSLLGTCPGSQAFDISRLQTLMASKYRRILFAHFGNKKIRRVVNA